MTTYKERTLLPKESQKIDKNYEKLQELSCKIGNEKTREAVQKLLNDIKQRFAYAPSSTKIEFAGAYPGGLVQTSMLVLRSLIQMNDALQANIPLDDMIITGIFFNIGKIGTEDKEYYLPQESEWHRVNLGQMYKINTEISEAISPNVRSLWWLNNADIPLTEDMIYSINSLSILTGNQVSNNSDVYKAPTLAILLQTAYRLVCSQSVDKKRSIVD